jgi:peptidoglycan/xylan/chitin deacetylase (PgdA/CDA1 family)
MLNVEHSIMSRHAIVTLFVLLAMFPLRAATRSVAITFDDLPDITAGEDNFAQQQRMTTNLLASLLRQRVPAIGFVNEDKLLGDDGQQDPRRVHLVEQWLEAGLEIGNHTYSHEDLHEVGPDEFESNILRGEATIRATVERRGLRLQWFRHPYLDSGKTVEVRDRIDRFLAEHGYRVAPVTIDNSEWIYELAYRKAGALRRPFIRRSYIRYMRERFAWDEERSRIVFGREIPQVLLLHAGALNADAFDGLAEMIRGRGYEFVSIESATGDPAYVTPERWTDGGVSWLERWGVEKGISDDRFTHDPKVPPWIQRLAGAKEE